MFKPNRSLHNTHDLFPLEPAISTPCNHNTGSLKASLESRGPLPLAEVGPGESEKAIALSQVARAHVRRGDLDGVRAGEPARLAVAGALAVVPT